MPQKRVKTPKGGPQKAPKGAKKAKVVAPPSPSDSEDSDDSEESSEEEMETKAVTPKNSKAVAKKAPAKAADSDDDDDDSDDSDESEEEAKPAAKTKKVEKKMEVDDSDDDSDDDDDDDDDDDEEEEVAEPKKAAAPKLNGKKAADSDEDDSDDDDSEDDDEDDDEDDSDEEEEVQQQNSNKRKKEQKETKTKKAKKEEPSGETVTIFCGNLDKESSAKELEKFFVSNGIPVANSRKVDNKRFGYVDLQNASDVDKALALNGTNDMKIDRANAKPAAGGTSRENEEHTLFVKNLADSVTEDTLKKFFPKATEVRLSKNREGDGHRGFAHIVFEEKAQLEKVLKKKQGADLEGQALYLDVSGPRGGKSPGGRGGFKSPRGGRGGGHQSSGEAGKTKVLFVKNLSYSSTEDSLKDAFPGASSARIAKDRDSNRSKGFGFVEFDSPEAASEAFNEMKGQEVDGRQIFLDFASDRKEGGGGGRGGFRGGRGGRGGGFRGGRGGRGGGRGGKSPAAKGNIQNFQGKKKTFADDSD